MAHVFIPAPLREMTGHARETHVEGSSLGEVIANLDAKYPGIAARLCQDDMLAAGIAASIDGSLVSRSLLAKVSPESEIHFLPALAGG